jgi:3-deoxy-D-manno-octulosonic-acid transferase
MKPSIFQRFILTLYGWVMCALIPFLVLKVHRRSRGEPIYQNNWKQRLGYYSDIKPSTDWVWIHAVSLGETRAAGILINALRHQYPNLKLLLTHGTATGWQEGSRYLEPGDIQVWQPWDTPSIVSRFLQTFRPKIGILIETEVWPHLIEACHQRAIPMYLVNARLSQRSLVKAMRFKSLMVPAYSRLHTVLAQTQEDAKHLRLLGAPADQVMGNLKYDISIEQSQQQLGLQWRSQVTRPVVMLASSRQGEEAQWLAALKQAKDMIESVQWLIVPRHPQRFNEVIQLIEKHGFIVKPRSQWHHNMPPPCGPSTIWVGDSIGEMQAYYHLASIAWLGGSFGSFGGQNLIEAAACSCPIIVGPHTFNFAEAVSQGQVFGASLLSQDMKHAIELSRHLLNQPLELKAMQSGAKEWLSQSYGISLILAKFISTKLD